MKIISLTLAILVGLLLLGAIGYAGIASIGYLNTLYMSMDPQVARVTTIASIVAIFCALMIASGLKSNNPNSLPAEKVTLYQQLLVHWSEFLKNASVGEVRVADGELVSLEQRLALHGNPKVIAAHINLCKSTEQEGKLGDKSRDMLKKLHIEMRADIGRTEMNLNKNGPLDLLLGRR